MSQDKTKESWDIRHTKTFINLCLDEVNKGERNGTSLSKKRWAAVIVGFNAKYSTNYNMTQFKNCWNSLKKEWMAWDHLFGKETDLGWDPIKQIVIASDEWWEQKELENPNYAKYRNGGFMFAQELTLLFKGRTANGLFAWAPSHGILPNVGEGDDDVYRPYFDHEEGFGDSEEDLHCLTTGANTGISNDMRYMNLKNCQSDYIEKSNGKRKRVGSSEGKKKQKATTSRHLFDAVSRISDSIETKAQVQNSSSIGEVIAKLQTIEAITSNPEWHARCCELLLDKTKREMFMELKSNEKQLLEWLKFSAYRL